MKIRILHPDEFDLLVREQAGAGTGELTFEGVADLVRSQSLALGPTPRRVLLDTVERLVGSAVAVDRGLILEAVGRLEETGDLLVGERGRIGPAPLRAVALTEGTYLILGALPNDDARTRFEAEIGIAGAVRRAVIDPTGADAFESEVRALGGVVLSLERYAGLDINPPAGDEWLAGLDNLAGSVSNTPTVEPLDMQAYTPSAGQAIQGRRWKRAPSLPSQGLVRWPREGGWYEYAWVLAGDAAKLVGLSKDEARRTMFSLDLQKGCPVVVQVTRNEKQVVLDIDTVLPFAEYRALLGLMNRMTWREWPVKYGGEHERATKACSMLEERLGVICSGVEGVFDGEA